MKAATVMMCLSGLAARSKSKGLPTYQLLKLKRIELCCDSEVIMNFCLLLCFMYDFQ